MTAVSERSALGRRGITKGDRRQTAILDSTETLLAKQPWHQLNIAKITELTGISRSTFYFYFSSREALLGALLERVLEQAGREPDDGWLTRPSDVRPLVALRSTFSHILDQWESHGAVLSQAACNTANSCFPELTSAGSCPGSSMRAVVPVGISTTAVRSPSSSRHCTEAVP